MQNPSSGSFHFPSSSASLLAALKRENTLSLSRVTLAYSSLLKKSPPTGTTVLLYTWPEAAEAPTSPAEAAAEEAVGRKTLAAVEKTITKARTDSDPAGALFGTLTARVTTAKKTSLKIQWKKVSGAAGYVIYANRCGKNNRYVKVAELKGGSKKSYTLTKISGKKLRKNTYYKILVAAYKTTSYGEKRVLSTAKVIHAATSGGKNGNPSKLTVTKKKLTLKKKQKVKLKAVQKAKSGTVIKNHRAVSFESSNPKVASVTKKGVVKGVKKGSCLIYVYTQNGLYKKIKVTVR